jgi:dTMP kinase
LPSYFITFEGPEGSGKSTQAQLLADYMIGKGLDVRLTREPGGDPVSEEIRKILLDGEDHSVTDRTELLLYLAARAEHTDLVIRPSLENGCIVICGRYIESTVAYQGYAGGLDLESIRRLNAFATGGLLPDLTFLLDVDVEVGLRRQSEWNRMERKAVEYHKRVREGFLSEARIHTERIVVLDASQDIQSLHQRIVEIVELRDE